MKFYLGIDMGGTGIKIAVIDEKSNIVDMAVLSTDTTINPEEFLYQIYTEASKLNSFDKAETIGFGTAGDIDQKKGILRYAYNLPNWDNTPIKDILQKFSNKEVFLDNDANTASLGAFQLDTNAEANNLICITLGTGIGGGLVLNKRLYRGASGSAGEIGHITIDYAGLQCNCGNIGCAEAYLGSKGFQNYAINYMKNNNSDIINKLTAGDLSNINAKVLFEAANQKDKVAQDLWDYYGRKLGILIASLVNTINPDYVVVCGGLSKAFDLFVQPLKDEVKKRAFAMPANTYKIMSSKYSNKLGVVGAALLVNQQ